MSLVHVHIFNGGLVFILNWLIFIVFIMRLFLKLIGLHQRIPPSLVSIFCNTMDVKKSQRVPLLHFSALKGQKSHFKKFFRKLFQVTKGSPFNFLKIFCNQLEFHKARRAPLFNFEPQIWRRLWPFSAC